MKIVILLFDQFTALDIVGPYEVLSRIHGAKIFFTADKKGIYSDPYGLFLQASHSIDDIGPADVLLVPGGYGIDMLLSNERVLDWIRKLDQATQWTTSVCSGALLLAAAGLLSNKKCTTHWRRIEQLRRYNVKIEEQRYIEDGKYITSAGVSAGIDMALLLASKLVGLDEARNLQMQIEYDPSPPFAFDRSLLPGRPS